MELRALLQVPEGSRYVEEAQMIVKVSVRGALCPGAFAKSSNQSAMFEVNQRWQMKANKVQHPEKESMAR